MRPTVSQEARHLGYLLGALEVDPNDIAWRMRAAESMLTQDMLVLAVEQCTRVLDQDPGHRAATSLLSRISGALSQHAPLTQD